MQKQTFSLRIGHDPLGSKTFILEFVWRADRPFTNERKCFSSHFHDFTSLGFISLGKEICEASAGSFGLCFQLRYLFVKCRCFYLRTYGKPNQPLLASANLTLLIWNMLDDDLWYDICISSNEIIILGHKWWQKTGSEKYSDIMVT